MKRSIAISLLAITIIFCTALYSFASTGIVTTDTLRLRKEASIEASIVALLSMDDQVEILEEKNGWYKVKAEVDNEKVEGYASAKYIEQESDKTTTEDKKETEDNKTVESKKENNEESKAIEEQTNTEEKEDKDTEQKIKVKILANGIKIYITPVINSIILNTLEKEEQIEITSETNGWSYITTGNIKGWVRTENIAEKEISAPVQDNSSQKTGYISGNSVNFREGASTSAKVITRLLKNTQVKVINEENDWLKIEYNGKTGYVSKTYVSDKKVAITSRSSTSRAKTQTKATNKNKEANVTKTVAQAENAKVEKKEEIQNSSTSKKGATGAEIVAYAKNYLGSKYVYGGSSPSGFDCSGFTSYVYKHFGYSLSRSSSAQSGNGRAVGKENLQEGDIICFARNSGSHKIGHVGIYIGSGKFIHAANSRKGVIISNVSGDGFYYVCARRII